MGTEAIRNMIDNIFSNKEADALNDFNTAVAEKLTDSLENRKQEIAAGLGQANEDQTVVYQQKPPVHMDPLIHSVMTVVDKLTRDKEKPSDKSPEKPAAQGKTPTQSNTTPSK